jgi:hypothetical protein
VRSHYGAGLVTMIDVDPSHLDEAGKKHFASLVNLRQFSPLSERRYGEPDEDAALRFLQDIPGVEPFDPSLMLLAILGLMVLAGPVDWFVLKLARRQPWTWYTTAGWAGLVTIGALVLAERSRTTPSAYRSAAMIEVAGDRVVSRKTATCVYADRTQTYAMTAADEEWWSFGVDRPGGYVRRAALPNVFDQQTTGTSPRPARVSVWNVLTMTCRAFVDEPSPLRVSVKRQTNGQGLRVQIVPADGIFTGTVVCMNASSRYVMHSSDGRPLEPIAGLREVTLKPTKKAYDPHLLLLSSDTFAEVPAGRDPYRVDDDHAVVLVEATAPRPADLLPGAALSDHRWFVRFHVPIEPARQPEEAPR